MALLVRTPELWSINARALLSSKNIDPVMLQSQYTNIYFPWDSNYDAERTYYLLIIWIDIDLMKI